MTVQVDQLPIARGQVADHGIHPVQIASGNACLHTKKVTGIVSEGRVINVAEQDGPHGKCMQERGQQFSKAQDALSAIRRKSGEEIVAANRYQSDCWPAPLKPSCLPGKIFNPAAILCPMVKLSGQERRQITALEIREQTVVIPHDQLPRMYAVIVVPGAVEDRIPEGV